MHKATRRSPDHGIRYTSCTLARNCEDRAWMYDARRWCVGPSWRSIHLSSTHAQDTMFGYWRTYIQPKFQLSLTNIFYVHYMFYKALSRMETPMMRTNWFWPRKPRKTRLNSWFCEKETTQGMDFCKYPKEIRNTGDQKGHAEQEPD